jgi:hypothetical protein
MLDKLDDTLKAIAGDLGDASFSMEGSAEKSLDREA